MTAALTVSDADIVAAAAVVRGAVVETPCLESKTLSQIAGCQLFVKFENLQFTASYKERGALNKLHTLDADQRRKGVIAMSAGNHAQGLAYHARRLGIPATIVMPKGTPFTKVARTRDHGATVVLVGETLDEAMQEARKIARDEDRVFVHPFDDPAVIAGQGTVGLEILAAVPDVDTIVVPIGGGGLISGIATLVKSRAPHVRIIGVQAAGYPSMARAIAGDGAAVVGGLTIAEGIAVKSPGTLTRPIVAALVDEIMVVDEAAIEHAIALYLSVEKTVVEGAGAAPLAAVLADPKRFAGRKVAVPITGGNIDLRVLASVAMRELVRNHQLIRLQASVSDQPGSLSTFTRAVGEAGGNILEISHDRLSLGFTAKRALLDVTVEVQDQRHGERLVHDLEQSGYKVTVVTAPV